MKQKKQVKVTIKMKEPEVEVLKPEEMSDQEMADLCEEETNKQLKLIYKELTRKLFE